MNNSEINAISNGGECFGFAYTNGEKAYWLTNGNLACNPTYSTAIEHWNYNPNDMTLGVIYVGSTAFYRYEGVPMRVIFDLMLAKSLGSFIANVVKPVYSVAA